MQSLKTFRLERKLEDAEDVLALALVYVRELEAELFGRRQNPDAIPNGFLGFLGKQVKKRRTRKKAEKAIAKEAVAKYRASSAREKAKAAEKE
jgi:hypothetical protein